MREQEICDALLGHFQVRKTVGQKAAFAQWVQKQARELGMPVKIERSGRWIDTRNLVIGDVEHAKVLITAHYDTCARLPFPCVMTPQCWPLLIATQILLPVIVFGAIGFAVGAALNAALEGVAVIWRLLVCLTGTCGLMAGLVFLLLAGPANPHTANDNTSGVALVLLSMARFAGREDVAFVLFDNEEKGLLGASAFARTHPASRALVVNFDCVGDGGTMLFTGSKAAMRHPVARRLAHVLGEFAPRHGLRCRLGVSPGTLYPSDQMAFARGCAFAALKGRRVLYLDRIHTPADTQLDLRNLRCLLDVLGTALARNASAPGRT